MEEIKKKVGRQSVELARQEKKIRNLKYEQTKLKKSIEKLKEKLKIATEALEFYAGMGHINNVVACSNIENHCYCEGDIENGYKAEKALEKIKEK